MDGKQVDVSVVRLIFGLDREPGQIRIGLAGHRFRRRGCSEAEAHSKQRCGKSFHNKTPFKSVRR